MHVCTDGSMHVCMSRGGPACLLRKWSFSATFVNARVHRGVYARVHVSRERSDVCKCTCAQGGLWRCARVEEGQYVFLSAASERERGGGSN